MMVGALAVMEDDGINNETRVEGSCLRNKGVVMKGTATMIALARPPLQCE